MTNSSNAPLIISTRPIPNTLNQKIQSVGIALRPFPAIEITAPLAPEKLPTTLGQLTQYDVILFISPIAVNKAAIWLKKHALTWPKSLKLAAMGPATAAMLKKQTTAAVIIPPSDFTSEALLALPEFVDIHGKKLLLVSGNAGRPVLENTLKQRGALVDRAEVYGRRCPQVEPQALLQALAAHPQRLIIITSGEALNNLITLVQNERSLLLETPLLVSSPRLNKQACALGFKQIHLAKDATDDALLVALKLVNF